VSDRHFSILFAIAYNPHQAKITLQAGMISIRSLAPFRDILVTYLLLGCWILVSILYAAIYLAVALVPSSFTNSYLMFPIKSKGGNDLSGTIPNTIGDLTSLTRLDFSKYSLRREISCRCLGSLFFY
jgi:hypothetical protein